MPSNRRRPGKRPRADPAPRAERKKSAPAAARPKPRRPAPAAKAAEAEAQSTPEPQEPLEPEVVEPEAVAAEPEVLPPEGEAETTLPVRVEERDLAHADALQRYMAEVARHPLLTREEEHELAVKFRETQDPRIAYRLVTANLRLVVKIAHEYRRAAFSLLDLVQEGNVGLMQAVQKYDPFRGVKLSSYAAWWIRAYILRYLMDNWRMVKLGTTQAQRKLFFNLRKEQEKLMKQGFEAAPKLLAERLDVTEQDVREMDQRLGNDEFSLDTPVGGVDDARQTYGDRIMETARPAEEQLADEQLRRVFKEKLAEFGKRLTDPKDRFLFEHRLSLGDGEEPMTLQEVGDKFGFTRERARQLEARLTDRLREHLRRELPDFAELSVKRRED
ncbi:MAG: sigma-70 family RNA polymerase sigma factor [Deltaproteobacteria bacterium]|nr:MAG: sigma-70 family RNA polymerase sigma factor [Deltaproteobacteria bacterium]